MTTQNPSEAFFAAWFSVTGQEHDARIVKQHERTAWEFLKAGFLPSELERVCRYMQKENTKGGRFKIQLHKVAGELDRFASILADVKAQDRNRRPLPIERDRILAAREKAAEPETTDPRINGTGRHLSDVLKTIANQ